MTHLGPNDFLSECWLLGRVGALEGSLWAPWVHVDPWCSLVDIALLMDPTEGIPLCLPPS